MKEIVVKANEFRKIFTHFKKNLYKDKDGDKWIWKGFDDKQGENVRMKKWQE